MLMRILAAALITLAVILALAGIVPEWLVSDGLDDLPVELRPVGEMALRAAKIACNEPIDRLLSWKLRVVRVDRVPGRCPLRGKVAPDYQDPYLVLKEYRVLVRRHTFFGIPIGTITVCGDAGACFEAEAEGFDRPSTLDRPGRAVPQ